MFFIFLLAQRHLHPADVENRPDGLTINIFIGRQVGRVSIRAISYYAFGSVFLLFLFKIKTHYRLRVFAYLKTSLFQRTLS